MICYQNRIASSIQHFSIIISPTKTATNNNIHIYIYIYDAAPSKNNVMYRNISYFLYLVQLYCVQYIYVVLYLQSVTCLGIHNKCSSKRVHLQIRGQLWRPPLCLKIIHCVCLIFLKEKKGVVVLYCIVFMFISIFLCIYIYTYGYIHMLLYSAWYYIIVYYIILYHSVILCYLILYYIIPYYLVLHYIE